MYIPDLLRPVEALMPPTGFDERIPGETMTQYAPMYQFSNMVFWIKNSAAGRQFTQMYLDNVTHLMQHCHDHRLADQKAQRSALASLIFSVRGTPNSCALTSDWRCNMYVPCLDNGLLQSHGLHKGAQKPQARVF